jgi:excisionase family DNA binding protein
MAEETGRVFSIKEIIKMLGISKPTLCRIMKRGEIGYYRVGSRVLFSEHHISKYLQSVEYSPEKETYNNIHQ